MSMSTDDTETSCERFLISLGRYQQEFHGAPCLVSLMPSKRELRRAGPEAIFPIGDVIRTWQISQSSVAVSHENLDVEYYCLTTSCIKEYSSRTF